MAKTYINGIRVLVLNALMEKKQLMDQLVQEIVKNIIMYLALIVLYLIVIFFKVSQFHSPIAKQLIQIQIALNVIMDIIASSSWQEVTHPDLFAAKYPVKHRSH